MPAPTVPGLTHIVLLTPKRRVDMSLPEHVSLAHLHATLLRHGGEDLVEDGVSRGGWVVRRVDGTSLDAGLSLSGLGVRNGDVLLLSYRDQHWPEPTFDDLAEGVADEAAKLGAIWQGATSSKAGVTVAGVLLASGLWLVLSTGSPWVAPVCFPLSWPWCCSASPHSSPAGYTIRRSPGCSAPSAWPTPP